MKIYTLFEEIYLQLITFNLIIPGLFNKVLKLTRERNGYLANKFIIFSNRVNVLFFRKKVKKFYKIIMIKVSKSFFTNVVYTGGAHEPSRVIKYLIINNILNLLLIAGIAKLYLRNIFLGK